MPSTWQGQHSPPQSASGDSHWELGCGGRWDIQVAFQVCEVLEDEVHFFWNVPKEGGLHLMKAKSERIHS